MPIHLDNSYARELPQACVPWRPQAAPRPRELFWNEDLAQTLDTGLADWDLAQREAVFGGVRLPEGAFPVAQAYAGHQFGGFSPQLGDGRALLLGELIDRNGQRVDLAFKGSGRTPFARGGDGKAAVGPMLREVLIGEALHAMGIPSTRALAVVATGESVPRERVLPGAILTRVAHSHLRVGTFQYFAARGDESGLQRLLDYTVQRHRPAPECFAQAQGDGALSLLMAVLRRQARLVAQWMGVGFIHGVMNTDNMSLSGQSIDFGPCAFMEVHDPATVYSSIDHHGRYAYGRQPAIAQWNLARLAEALLPVMQGPQEQRLEAATDVIESFSAVFDEAMALVWCRKLGWPESVPPTEVRGWAQEWQALMQAHQVDHTSGWRALVEAAQGHVPGLLDQFGAGAAQAQQWLVRWQTQSKASGRGIDTQICKQANPLVIPRNHLVEAALQAASDQGDLQPFESLLNAVRQPWSEDPALRPYAQAAPPEVAASHRTFCGT
jgi:uncharacterized protein YdiU (UPF0061 family)